MNNCKQCEELKRRAEEAEKRVSELEKMLMTGDVDKCLRSQGKKIIELEQENVTLRERLAQDKDFWCKDCGDVAALREKIRQLEHDISCQQDAIDTLTAENVEMRKRSEEMP